MSLFGAATSGVDPQTGSYLSKDQRIAMFMRSRGRGGSGSGVGGRNGGVSPQASIVVVNKMSASIEKLQTTFQDTTEVVSDQVVENKNAVENLYKLILDKRKEELKEEKAETTRTRRSLEDFLRKSKENLVEGLSSIASGLFSSFKAVGDVVKKPIGGLLQRILGLLGNLAAAFLIKNLPQIIDNIKSWDLSFENIKETLKEKLLETRGLGSALARIFRPVTDLLSKIVSKSAQVAKKILGKAITIGGKVFGAVRNFVTNLVRNIVAGASKLVSNAYKSIKDAFIKPPTTKPTSPDKPGGGTPRARKASGMDPADGAKAGKPKPVPPKRNFFQKAYDAIRGGGKTKGAQPSLSGALGKMQEGMTGVKPQTNAVRANWLAKALSPIGKAYPALKGALGGVLKLSKGVLKIVPGIGFAIDLALNKGVAGQNWTEAIINALGSSIVGGLSAVAGAKVGGTVGFGVGAAFGGVGAIPGAAIGAALGGIIAGIAGGAAGDMAGKQINKALGTSSNPDNEVMGTDAISSVLRDGMLRPVTDFITGAKPENETKVQSSSTKIETLSGSDVHAPLGDQVKLNVRNYSQTAAGGSTAIDGMDTSKIFGADSNAVNFIELPPIKTNKPARRESESNTQGQTIPSFNTSDSSMDYYRAIAAKEFQLL